MACLHMSTWRLHMNTWKAAATQVTRRWRKTTTRGARWWRHSRCRDPAQRYSRASLIGRYAGWHCRATSRWTLFTRPWSPSTVHELLVTKRGNGREAAGTWALSGMDKDGLGPSAPRKGSQFCLGFARDLNSWTVFVCSRDRIALRDPLECPRIITEYHILTSTQEELMQESPIPPWLVELAGSIPCR